MKKSTFIIVVLTLIFLLLSWFQNYHYSKKFELQNAAFQKLLVEKEATDSLSTYFESIQKAQFYFLNDRDSLAFDLLKPYGTLSDSIKRLFQRVKSSDRSDVVIVNRSEGEEIVDKRQELDVSEISKLENDLLKNELSAVKQELNELKTPKPLLDLVSSKGVKFQYIGQIKNGKADGFGIGLFESGSIYKGFWKKNNRDGNGVFTWKDGERYEGLYVNDKREGQGDYYWKNGETFKGQWREDKRNGEGKLFKRNGKLKNEGTWVDDKFKP